MFSSYVSSQADTQSCPHRSFKKSNLRRTIVASMPLSIQAFCGVFWVAGFSTYYMQLAGYSTAMSFKLGIVQQVISMIGNLCAVSRVLLLCLVFDYIYTNCLLRSALPSPVCLDRTSRTSSSHSLGYRRLDNSAHGHWRSSMRRYPFCQQGHSCLDPLLLLALQRDHWRNGLRRSGRDRDVKAES